MEHPEVQTPEYQAWLARLARFERLTGVKVKSNPEAIQDMYALHGLNAYDEMEEALLGQWAHATQAKKLAFVGQEEWMVRREDGLPRENLEAHLQRMRAGAVLTPGQTVTSKMILCLTYGDANPSWLDLRTGQRHETPLKPYLDFLAVKLLEEVEGTDAQDELKHQQERLVKQAKAGRGPKPSLLDATPL